MSFIWPMMLLSLLLLPLFVVLYLWQQRRQRLVARYGSFGLMYETADQQLGWRRHLPPLLFLLGLTMLLVALARPETTVSLPRMEGTVILAFDVSGSMVADDLQPTRMEAAKAAAQTFIENQPTTVQIGIVAFSDGGFTVQVPTNDTEALLATINRLTPQRGTSLGQGILTALNIIAAETGQDTQVEEIDPALTPTPVPPGTFTPAIIVLLTDGENNQDPDPLLAAQAAADRGVRIYTIGVGSATGTSLTVEGFTVHTQLDEPTLERISQLTEGVYYRAENEAELDTIYDNLDSQLVIKPEKMEVTSIFAGTSLIVLLLGGAFSLWWFGRLP
jgi:Ca-activated chloride channel family protein